MITRRPGIYQVGQVIDDGQTVTITGWGLSLCMFSCSCHRHPYSGGLHVEQDHEHGRLGLVQHRPCGCCAPWTADELKAVVRDLAGANLTPPGGISQ